MVKYVECKKGNKFVLTLLGTEIPRIRAKFNENHIACKRYQHNVPESWIDAGYVIEVKKEN